jgi:hypothetical protein
MEWRLPKIIKFRERRIKPANRTRLFAVSFFVAVTVALAGWLWLIAWAVWKLLGLVWGAIPT